MVTEVAAHVQTLDSVISSRRVSRADFVKCDVEGAEMAVFKGGATLFDREDAPMVLYEADARSAEAFGLDIAGATRLLRGFARAAYSFLWVRQNAMVQQIESPGGPWDRDSNCQRLIIGAV